ncbi:MAG: hypothetical protein ACJAZO_002729 [Myxococcota bacterium]|jgi:hypothetical protein
MKKERANGIVDSMFAIAALVPALVSFSAFVGLGMHRNAPSGVLVATAAALVFGPPLALGLTVRRRKGLVLGVSGVLWSLFLFMAIPVYFPQERVDALASGLGVLRLGPAWQGLARDVAESMPEDPGLARPQLPEAAATPEPIVFAPLDLADNQIALPFEGEGRRLAVPVVFEHNGRSVETWMMLDTGATYTTLPRSILYELGVEPGDDAPVLTLHTANGDRQASFALTDTVWLGNLPLNGVALAECNECASGEISGLLGLNVTGSYNLTIDSDRKEVVFSERAARQQHLDVSPFTDVGARFTRLAGGRVEVEVTVDNDSQRPILKAVGEVSCAGGSWRIEVFDIPAGTSRSVMERLPAHERCESYRISLVDASW